MYSVNNLAQSNDLDPKQSPRQCSGSPCFSVYIPKGTGVLGREGASCPPAMRRRDLWAFSGPGYLAAGGISLIFLVIMAPTGLWNCLGLIHSSAFGNALDGVPLNNLTSPHSCSLQTPILQNPPSRPANLTQSSLSGEIIPPCTVDPMAVPWSFKVAPMPFENQRLPRNSILISPLPDHPRCKKVTDGLKMLSYPTAPSQGWPLAGIWELGTRESSYHTN